MTQPDSALHGPAEAPPLTPKQELAAVATARGLSVAAVAKAAECGERTLKTWRAQPAFRRRVAELRAEMTDRAVGALADGMGSAVAALRKLLTSKSDGVRLSAARTVLEVGVKLREAAELQGELDELRQQVAALATTRGRAR